MDYRNVSSFLGLGNSKQSETIYNRWNGSHFEDISIREFNWRINGTSIDFRIIKWNGTIVSNIIALLMAN